MFFNANNALQCMITFVKFTEGMKHNEGMAQDVNKEKKNVHDMYSRGQSLLNNKNQWDVSTKRGTLNRTINDF